MKISYLGTGIISAAMMLAVGSNAVFGRQIQSAGATEKVQTDSDSLKVLNLAKDLKKLKPLSAGDFKSKFKKEINGYQLTEATAFEDNDTGSYATANYKKGSKNVYLMVKDGAGAGSEEVKESLLSYLELKKIEEPEDKTNIKSYKGWQVYFDYSMYENDQLTSIQYLEGNRFSIVASGNNVPIEELKGLLDHLSL
ncbi:MAG: hypothetical protein LBE92_01840 [Chryseobacterium sp.]|jgi:hypothetical protein|uniref:hypothetical protein n=1 Tax=Chryseobacterium sp. TaxID=1871047 RepID=UPI00281FFE61|nr:hypothetical protein [Chryseobacterium sp.]MDR2234840.1 hypothetical protein [Chryseobacterium sp.]